jgi:hypothetical protein
MSMLPCGQPEPAETTLVILNEDGAGEESGTGVAREDAARARVVRMYFIVRDDAGVQICGNKSTKVGRSDEKNV